ncbi:PaaI family thioesterase [uncultured Chitinophaga sp.]|uniref:PaaI family thioesterase n=1 Tax=uncultured Chitinophaga sp. TaxID=339340 RepID=UPI00260D7B49|nr:PaaI family thioesterase [uncultured Chitinophaga sp.]
MAATNRIRTHDWANPLETAEKAKTLAGIDFLNATLNKEIPYPPIASTLDFTPLSAEQGKVRFEFIPQEFHYNPIGTVHGGVICTVLDTVMGCAVHSTLPQGVAYTTLELKVNFIKGVTIKSGKMIAEGRLIHAGRSTALVEGDLRSENGILYAHGVSTCMILTA